MHLQSTQSTPLLHVYRSLVGYNAANYTLRRGNGRVTRPTLSLPLRGVHNSFNDLGYEFARREMEIGLG